MRVIRPRSRKYFVSETSIYRLLKAHDVITSPAPSVGKAADVFAEPTTAYFAPVAFGYLATTTPHSLERSAGLKVLTIPDKRLKLLQTRPQVFEASDLLLHCLG